MVELADTIDLGSIGRPWGFESLHPHEKALRPCAGLRAFVILKDILLERENVDGLFIFDICDIFYHIGYLLLCGAKETALGRIITFQYNILCLVGAVFDRLSAV